MDSSPTPVEELLPKIILNFLLSNPYFLISLFRNEVAVLDPIGKKFRLVFVTHKR